MATVHAPSSSSEAGLHQGPFINEPLTDFSRDENARQMRAAIQKVRNELGREYDLVIGGQRIKTAKKIESLNPAKPAEVVGIHQKADTEHVEPAMQAALKAFATWSRTPVEERAALVFRVAEILRERKFEYAAWMVFEVGKNWAEADGGRRGDSALEFSQRHHGRHDAGFHRVRQHCHPQAIVRFPHHRSQVH